MRRFISFTHYLFIRILLCLHHPLCQFVTGQVEKDNYDQGLHTHIQIKKGPAITRVTLALNVYSGAPGIWNNNYTGALSSSH